MNTMQQKMTRAARLRAARHAKGFRSATEAATALGVNRDTYVQHENGTRSYDRSIQLYADKFGVSPAWLIFGQDPPKWYSESDESGVASETVPVVGYVGAGAVATLYAEGQGPMYYVDPPRNPKPETVAAEVHGVSLGPAFDGSLVFYNDVRSPVTEDLYNRLCVVGTSDGRVLVKMIVPASEGRYHLLSNIAEPPLLDQHVIWAAKVTDIRPR